MDLYGANNAPMVEEETIDLRELLSLLWEKKWLIILAGIAGAALALGFTLFFIKPMYRSGFVAFINNRSQSQNTEALTNGDTAAAQSLTYTYAEIIKNRAVLSEAAAKTGLSNFYTEEQLSNLVSTSIVSQTQLINVYATMETPEDAYRFATAISEIAPTYIAEIVEGSSMKIASKAIMPTHKFSPSNTRNTMIGLMLGIVLAVAIIIIRDLADTRMKSEDDLKSHYDIPIVGTIPNVDEASEGRGGYAYGYGTSSKKKSQSGNGAGASKGGDK